MGFEEKKKKRKGKIWGGVAMVEEMGFRVCFWMNGEDELKMKGPNRFSKNGYKIGLSRSKNPFIFYLYYFYIWYIKYKIEILLNIYIYIYIYIYI